MQTLRPTRLPLVLAALLALVLTACPDDAPDVVDDDDAPAEGTIADQFDLSGLEVTIGSKEFTEQLILGWLAYEALEAAGASVNDQIGLGGTAENRTALEAGEIDIYWEYTGTGWITHLGEVDPVPGAQEQYDAVAERDLEENSIRWLEPADPNNTYALAVSQESYEELGVEQISDLEQLIAERPDDVTICGTEEFMVREDGLPGMEAHYGFEVPAGNTTEMDPGIMYSTVVDNPEDCRFAAVFATDGRIAARDLHVLEDDQDFFPVYQPSLNVREEVFEEWPELEDLFALVVANLDTETLQEMNAEVDELAAEPRDVAVEFLQAGGLIP
jgi:osmoprotectant transport system substrate-binding protein